MLKCIHKSPVINAKVTKFVTNFNHYLSFEENRATLYDVDGNALSQFECRDKMQEGVFAENRAIVATDIQTLCFYNLRERTNKIIKSKKLIHALLPGPDSGSYYLATRRIKTIDLELISTRKENTVLRLRGISSIFSAIKRLYIEEAEPVEISISHAGAKTYISNKTQKVMVYSGAKPARTLRGFPLPIYKAIETPFDTPYFAGIQGKTVRVFDENKREIFTKELPFIIKDILSRSTTNNIVVVCEFGAIFMLNFRGDIVDGGFLAKEITSCQISPDGLLWCLTEDGSLMIVAQEEVEETEKIAQWLHLDTAGRKSPLQEALSKINEQDKEHKSKESALQLEQHKLNQKEKELKNLESELKQDSAKADSHLTQAKERERIAEAKLKHAEELEAEMQRLDSIEELSNRLKEHHAKAIEDKAEFKAKEEEINKITQEIKDTQVVKSALEEKIKQESEALSGLNAEIAKLTQEEESLANDSEELLKKISELKTLIQQKKLFFKNAPADIKDLEEKEKTYSLKVKELNNKLQGLKERIDKVSKEKEEIEKKLGLKTGELNQILQSAKIVSEKEKNIPEIYKLSQQLIKLIEKTHSGKGG